MGIGKGDGSFEYLSLLNEGFNSPMPWRLTIYKERILHSHSGWEIALTITNYISNVKNLYFILLSLLKFFHKFL